MPETSMPPPPKNSGSGPFIGAVIVMLLLMGGLLWWNFRPKPEEPKAQLPPVPTSPPRTDEEAPPPPPPIEPEPAPSASAPSSTKKVSAAGNGGCAATCAGNAGAPLQGALGGAAGSVRSCYEKALRNDPMLQGKLMVAVKISPTGSVCSAKIATDTLNGPGVASCVLNRFKGSSFPPPSGGCVDVNIPISFTPKK